VGGGGKDGTATVPVVKSGAVGSGCRTRAKVAVELLPLSPPPLLLPLLLVLPLVPGEPAPPKLLPLMGEAKRPREAGRWFPAAADADEA